MTPSGARILPIHTSLTSCRPGSMAVASSAILLMLGHCVHALYRVYVENNKIKAGLR